MKEEKVTLAGGHATSTIGVKFGRIPRQALVSLANRLDVGVERHGVMSWNGQSENFNEVNASLDWALERLGHVIDHSYAAIEKLMGLREWDGEDDAGAILFGGAVLACSKHWEEPAQSKDAETVGTDNSVSEHIHMILRRHQELKDSPQFVDSVIYHELDVLQQLFYKQNIIILENDGD